MSMRVDIKDATIKFKDGGSNSITVKVGEGNLTWTERKNRTYYKDRGRLDSVRDADEEPIELRIDLTWEEIKASSGDPPTIEDALKQRGEAASWVSSDANVCQPYAIDIEVTLDPPCEDQDREIILFSDFRYETLDHDLRGATISCTGKCNITEPAVARAAQT